MNNGFNKGFKNTEIGKIPIEWEVVRLSRVGKIKDGDWILKKDYTKQGTRLLQIGDIGVGIFLDKSNRFIGTERAKGLNCTFIEPEKDILISRMPDPIGRACIAPKLNYSYIVAVDISILKIDGSKVDKGFIVYSLNSKRSLKKVERLSSGATRLRISRKKIEMLFIPLPPLPEQKKVAEILSTVDQAIEKVDEAIAKTERLKKGLMQELMTKGIGHKDFKQTEIGKIPKEWEVVRLGEVVDINKESRDPNREFPEKKFLYIDIDSIENETGVIRSTKRIIGKEAPSRARRLIRYGDVIMSTVRPYLKAFAIVPREYDAQICSTGFAVLSCTERILASYLLYILFSNSVIGQCNRMMVGAQYPALNNSQVEKIEIPFASLPEQEKIAEILSTVDGRLQLLKARKEGFKRVKKGLMNDLLTGKRRVKI